MICVYEENEKNFNNNGIKILKPLQAIITKEDNGDYYLDLKDKIDNLEYYQSGFIIRVSTPWGKQGFRISNPKIQNKYITCRAYHLYFDTANYLIEDAYVVDKNCNDALDHLNNATDKKTPFSFISDIQNEKSYRCVRKSLEEALSDVIDRWGGHLKRDNFHIEIRDTIGEDRGIVLKYGKNITNITSEENWDNVVTKILPVGKDGLELPEKYIELEEEIYNIPYSKVIEFSQDVSEDNFKDENGILNETAYQNALIEDLRNQAKEYLENNKFPKVNYSVNAYIKDVSDVGDTLYILHPKCNINIVTNVIAIQYDCILEKYIKIEFGNFKSKLKNLIPSIKDNITKDVQKENNEHYVNLQKELKEATDKINNAMSNSYVIYDGSKILIVNKLPAEEAEFAILINNGGIGFSQNGINGPFNSAWTIDGILDMQQVNVINLVADMIKGGTLKLGGENNVNGKIEIYNSNGELINTIDNNGLVFSIGGSEVTFENFYNQTNQNFANFNVTLQGIQQEVSYFNDQSQSIAKLTTAIEGIQASIGSITNTTVNGTGVGSADLENVLTSEILYLQIYPTSEDLSYLNVSPKTFVSKNAKLTSRDLLFINKESNKTIKYTLPCNLYYISDDVKDELVVDYEKQQIFVIHRVGINAETGEKYALSTTKTTFYEYQGIIIDEGNYTIKMQSFNTAYINVRALANSLYTSQYATRVEVNNKLSLTESGIRQEVNGKFVTLEGNLKNIQGSLELKLNTKDLCSEIIGQADKIHFDGKIFTWTATNSSMNSSGTLTGKNVNLSGTITATSGTIGGCVIESGVLKVGNANITSINASKITAGTMSADRISGGTIDATKTTVKNLNATNITSGTIDASKITVKNLNASNITSGTISTSRLSSNVITTSNLSAQKISANQITTGTLSANRISGGTISGNNVSITNINASNLTSGTISSADVNIYNSVGFLKMLHGSAYHPFVSALNVARGSGGISFRNSGDRNNTGSQIGQIYADNNVIYISASNGTNVANYLKCGNIGISGVQIDGAQDTWIRMNYSVVLKPNPSGGAYIWGTEDYNKILTSSGSPSTLSIKENVKIKDTSDIPKMLEKINLYDYKYISEVENGKEDYGYIIDYLEKIDGIDKYFKFNNIDRNNIKYKTINHEHLSKFLLGAVIELQKQINDLKERILE